MELKAENFLLLVNKTTCCNPVLLKGWVTFCPLVIYWV